MIKWIFRDCFNELKREWQEDRVTFWLDLIGMFCGIYGAVAIAFFQGEADFLLAYLGYLVCSTFMSYTAWKYRKGKWLLLNLVFTIINIRGILLALGVT